MAIYVRCMAHLLVLSVYQYIMPPQIEQLFVANF